MEKAKKQSMTARFPRVMTKHLAFCLAATSCVGIAAQANKPPLSAPQKVQGLQGTQANRATGPLHTGAWFYTSYPGEELEVMTTKILSITLSSSNNNGTLFATLDCDTREIVLFIRTKFAIYNDSSITSVNCKVQYDNGDMSEMEFIRGEKNLFFLDIVKHLKRLSTCKVFRIQIPTKESWRVVTFSPDGIANRIAQMEAESGQKLDSWTNRYEDLIRRATK